MLADLTYVQTIGSFSVTQTGRKIPVGRAKVRALLAFLSVNKGRTYHREYLADLLWPDSDIKRAKHSLNQALYAIRRILPNLLATDELNVACDVPNVRTDVDMITELIRTGGGLSIANHVSGPFLGDLLLLGAQPFEDWRQQYHDDLFAVLEQALTSSLIKLDPQARSLELLQLAPRCTDLMPAVRSLVSTINRDLSTQEGTTQKGGRNEIGKITGAVTTAATWVTPMVGRSQQVAALNSCWQGCLREKAQYVIVTGNAGYGKTRLVSEFIDSLQPSARVLRVRCYESERRIGFGPITDLLSRSVVVADIERLEPIWSGALRELVPTLPGDCEGPPALSAAASRSRLFEAVLRLFANIAKDAPCLVLIDDVQWCDRSTRALLSYLSHRLENGRVMTVVCTRLRPAGRALHGTWDEWHHVTVGDLNPHDLSTLVSKLAERSSSTNLTPERLGKLTGGHPYLVAEAMSAETSRRLDSSIALQSEGTNRVDQFVGTLLQSIPGPAQKVIAVLAVLARPVSPRLVRRIANTRQVMKAIDRLVSQELVTVAHGRIALRHDLIREAAYRRIPMFSRTEIHRRSAEALRHKEQNAGETAQHFYKARQRTLAYQYAIKAVKQADERHAADESIFFVRLAIKADPRAALSLRLALAERLYRSHRLSAARIELQHLLTGSTLESTEFLSAKLLDLELCYALGELHGGQLRADLIPIKVKAQTENNLLFLRALCLELRSAYHDGIEPVIARSIHEVQSLAADDHRPEALEALSLAARVMSVVYSATTAQQWVQPVRRMLPEIGDHEARFRIMAALGDIEYNAGNLIGAESLERVTMDGIRAVGAMNMWPLTNSHIHMLLVEQGRYDDAKTVYRDTRSQAGALEAIHTVATLCGNHAQMLFELGDFIGAKEANTEALEFISRVTSVWIHMGLRALGGLIALEQGRLSDAIQAAQFGKTKLEELGMRVGDLSMLEILIARTDTLMGHRVQAIGRLREAIWDYRERDVVCRLRMQLELARMLKLDDKKEARQLATDVFTLARSINARPIAERAESLLQRL